MSEWEGERIVADVNEGKDRVLKVFDGNPAYRFLYAALIAFCEEERSLSEALEFAAASRTSASQILSPAAMVDTLVRCAALTERVLVDGVPYEGSREEAQADDALPENAVVETFVAATEAGLMAVAAQNAERSLDALFATHPEREAAFRAVLGWCAEGEGKTTRQLQELLKEADLLETEAARGIDGLHASYFTGTLESVGALAWNGKAWIAAK